MLEEKFDERGGSWLQPTGTPHPWHPTSKPQSPYLGRQVPLTRCLSSSRAQPPQGAQPSTATGRSWQPSGGVSTPVFKEPLVAAAKGAAPRPFGKWTDQ